ncbi:hypothetical protein Smp_162690 [Schistosoma mansoni]|uniref:hypothetical protein n=1 Tax=Schistosoma mansoni TaxID=6183 RepID=UPI0001A62998|nr:hypothetical protein Smp_162690 [Schistosoma mansoni]|eukprot:XP_018650886.1 hypothetical protein Smp_162690 [Schistosoma mansoni]
MVVRMILGNNFTASIYGQTGGVTVLVEQINAIAKIELPRVRKMLSVYLNRVENFGRPCTAKKQNRELGSS